MKKFIKTILLFILLAIIIYPLLIYIWGEIFKDQRYKPNLLYEIGAHGFSNSRFKEVKQQSNIDILFLGSSHTYRGFDTRIFENNDFKVFNLGTSSQTPIQTKVLLNRYLEKIRPKMIVYEVYPETFSIDGIESGLDFIANDIIDINTVIMVLKLGHLKAYNAFSYAIIKTYLIKDSAYNESPKKYKDTYIKGGFVEREIDFFLHKQYLPETWQLKKIQIEEFKENINIIKRLKIPIFLVFAPITKGKYESYTNNTSFDSLMSQYGVYYNFNKIVPLDDSLHFYDFDHLNQQGVEVFDRKLLEIIKSYLSN